MGTFLKKPLTYYYTKKQPLLFAMKLTYKIQPLLFTMTLNINLQIISLSFFLLLIYYLMASFLYNFSLQNFH